MLSNHVKWIKRQVAVSVYDFLVKAYDVKMMALPFLRKSFAERFLLKQTDLDDVDEKWCVDTELQLIQSGAFKRALIYSQTKKMSYEKLLLYSYVARKLKTKTLQRILKKVLRSQGAVFLNVPSGFFVNGEIGVFKGKRPHIQSDYVYDLNADYELYYKEHLVLGDSVGNLKKVDDSLWNVCGCVDFNLPEFPASHSAKENIVVERNRINDSLWCFELPDERLNNITDFLQRQWIRRYPENLPKAFLDEDMVILVNHYRIFALEKKSGRLLWSFAPADNDLSENIQDYRHYHHNVYAYPVFCCDDRIYAQFGGKLFCVAFSLTGADTCWATSLGEFYVSSEPFAYKEKLILGVVNAKQEFHFISVDMRDGHLLWDSFLGVSGDVTPASSSSVVSPNGIACISTNVGAFASLDLEDGNILWVRKYDAKEYAGDKLITDYKFQDCMFSDETLLPFDTEFVRFQGNDRVLFKSRESQSLYCLNVDSGGLIYEFDLQLSNILVLGLLKEVVIYISYINAARPKLILADIDSDVIIKEIRLSGKSLEGCIYDIDSIAFKSGSSVYSIKCVEDNVVVHVIDCQHAGWLCSCDRNGFVLNDKGSVSFYSFVSEHKNASGLSYERGLLQLNDLISHDDVCRLLDNGLFFESMIPFIVNEYASGNYFLSESNFEEVLRRSSGLFIKYNDVHLRVTELLLLFCNKAPVLKNEKKCFKDKSKESYSLIKDSMQLIPVEDVMSPAGFQSFFLVANFGQLLCVSEKGYILWMRNIFLGCIKSKAALNTESDLYWGRLYYGEVEAYVYENVLIINDNVNLIALNVDTGCYLWSMTNESTDVFDREKKKILSLSSQDQLLSNSGVSRDYLKSIKYWAFFINGSLIVLHSGKLYMPDFLTGYCEKVYDIPCDGIYNVAVDGSCLYIFNRDYSCAAVFNTVMKSFAEKNIRLSLEPSYYFKCQTFKGVFVFVSQKSVIIFDETLTKILLNLQNCEYPPYLHIDEDALLVVIPFTSIERYVYSEKRIVREYKLLMSSDPVEWKRVQAKSEVFFCFDEFMMIACQKKMRLCFKVVNIERGILVNEICLDDVVGEFSCMSKPIYFGKDIDFYVGMVKPTSQDGVDDYDVLILTSYLIQISIESSGDLTVRKIRKSTDMYFDVRSIDMGEKLQCQRTQNSMIYNDWGARLTVEKKRTDNGGLIF